MVKCLEEILIDLIAKRSTKSAMNKSAFLAYWPQIKELRAKNWKLTLICEALQEAGVHFKYSVLWKYVRQQSELEADIDPSMTPKDKPIPKPRKRRNGKSRITANDIGGDAAENNVAVGEKEAATISEPVQLGKRYGEQVF